MNSISKRKQGLAVFLLILSSIRMLVVPVVYLDFELNKTYIIQNLCENRFKPELNCNGQCYLAKQLHKVAEEKATKEANKQEQSFKKILEEVFHEETFAFTQNLAFECFEIQNFFEYKISQSISPISSIFHPPCFS